MSDSSDLSTPGDRIIAALGKRKRRELAAFVGVHEQKVSAWLSNSNKPSSKYLLKIAQFLDVSPDWILNGNVSGEITENVPRETLSDPSAADVDYLTGEVVRVATEFNIRRAQKGSREDVARSEGELKTLLRFMLKKIPRAEDREDAVNLFFKAFTSDSERSTKSARRQQHESRGGKSGTDRS